MKLHSDTRPFDQIDYDNLHSKNIFIQFPIPKICNMEPHYCPYCFHQEFFQNKENIQPYKDNIGFSIEEFDQWMLTHIYPNFSKIVVHCAGGEPFIPSNLDIISELFRFSYSRVRFDLLTNCMFTGNRIPDWVNLHGGRIHRIGCTFHRKVIGKRKDLCDRFDLNVHKLIDAGVKVYVKELLWKDELLDILRNRNRWIKRGVQFNIQDVQSIDGSPQNYNAHDLAFISDEYKHLGNYCSCWQGWHSISIRGYDIAAGDVVACWLDPKIIGNVKDNTLSMNFKVEIDESLRRRNVTGGDYNYSDKGTYIRDRKGCEH